MITRSGAAWGAVILLQTALCCHLYFTQLTLLSKMDQLTHTNFIDNAVGDQYGRSRREIRSAGLDSDNALLTNHTDDGDVISETMASTSTATPQRRRNYKKSHRGRGGVERYVVSTESTTVGPIMVRVSRTKTTGQAQHRSHARTVHNAGAAAALRAEEEIISAEVAMLPPAAIHFVSDASNYTRERHSHYAGNGRIKVSGIYRDWKPAQWTHTLGTNQHFSMDVGKLIVRQPGLYLFYAQIHYANVQEVNCYRAVLNGAVAAQCCSTTAHPDRHEIKANTCSLLTTLYLHPGDTLWLADLHERYVILTPERSYFGLVQLYTPPTH